MIYNIIAYVNNILLFQLSRYEKNNCVPLKLSIAWLVLKYHMSVETRGKVNAHDLFTQNTVTNILLAYHIPKIYVTENNNTKIIVHI